MHILPSFFFFNVWSVQFSLRTFLSGLAISGKMPQNGLITSKNLTENEKK